MTLDIIKQKFIINGVAMVKRRDVVAFFTVHGFINKGGSRHDRYEHPDGRWTVVPRHAEIDDMLFKMMKTQAGLK